ncbi:MAG TPA: ECF transporter S component [Candidatus Ruania gallistercoris]|uniref:ECF transporter S component n=1 Tax=Candidatus Ruania gallistercoris TaxID=2838746 RepID=A0A9D2J5Z3_9MICO|nr:ECF transporter S component [Candidatus Ruania gallistercoris]
MTAQREWAGQVSWRAGAAVPLGSRLAIVLVAVSLVGVLAFSWPLLISPGSALVQSTTAPLILAVVLAASLVVTLVAVSDGGMDVRAVAMLGVLSAVGALLRPVAAGTGGVESVFVLLVLGGRVFGPGFGFLLGVSTMFASALLTGGVGPWLPYQMLAAGWVGLGAGLLPARIGRRDLRGLGELVLLAVYGAIAAVGYGLVMNLSSWPYLAGAGTGISFVAGAPLTENVPRFLTYSVVTSLPWDLTRAVTTVIGVAVLGHVLLVTLRRAAKRAVFVEE